MITPIFGLALDSGASSPEALAASYGKWNGILSNHVIDINGRFVGADGSSRSISTLEDRQLLLALRSKAELIAVDAATARKEQYQMPRSGAKIALFSLSGDFSGIPAAESSASDCFLFSPGATNDLNQRELQTFEPANPFPSFMSWAHDQGLSSILLEAGATLTRIAFSTGAVGQSALTISGSNLGLRELQNVHPFDRDASIESVAHSADATFTYWTH